MRGFHAQGKEKERKHMSSVPYDHEKVGLKQRGLLGHGFIFAPSLLATRHCSIA